eukprot:3874224-Pleurochrysis_carterae.AAC.1
MSISISISISITMGSTTRYSWHSVRPVSGVADGINRVAAARRGNGTAASASALEWYVAGTCAASNLRRHFPVLFRHLAEHLA